MNPIHFAIHRPVTVSVGVILIILAGVIALTRIPVQLTPNVDPTVVQVKTTWLGASPQEIELDVVRRQEEKLKSITGLVRMSSESQLNEGVVKLEFGVGFDRNVALREVSDKLREVSGYPEGVEQPVVETSDPRNRDYIAWMIFSTPDEEFDMRRLQDFGDDIIKPELERVPGISEINVLGGFQREVQIRVDPERLAQRGITPTQLVDRLRAANASSSAGDFIYGTKQVRLRSEGRFRDLEQVELTIISDPALPVVRLRDVADVELTYKEPRSIVRNKGRTVLAINAQREVDSNVIAVMDGLKARLAAMNAPGGLLEQEASRQGIRGGLQLEQVFDQTVYVKRSIGLVQDNLWQGGSLAIIVLLLFLASIRSTMVIGLAIPVSVIGVFVAIVALGRNINVISLAGLAFAVGMVVDNAIVVLENIDRHLRLGKSPREAAFNATNEVWGAILASTLTTIAVFVPVLLIQEEAGQIFRDLSIAIVAAVALSLLVSITVIPSAAARFLSRRDRPALAGLLPGGMAADGSSGAGLAGSTATRGRSGRGVFVRGLDGFAGLMRWLCGTWLLRPAIIVLIVLGGIVAATLLMPPASYLPNGNRNLVFALLAAPPGLSLDAAQSYGERVENIVRPYWSAPPGSEAERNLPPIEVMDFATGQPVQIPGVAVQNFFFVAFGDILFAGATSRDEEQVAPVAMLLNKAIMEEMPFGVFGFALQLPLIRTGQGQGNTIEMELSGPDVNRVLAAAKAMDMPLRGRFGQRAVRTEPGNYDLPGPEDRIVLRRVAGNDVGITQRDLNVITQVAGDGALAGEFIYDGRSIDITIRAAAAPDNDPDRILDFPIFTPSGAVVPLLSVAERRTVVSPNRIDRVEEQPSVTFLLNLPPELALEDAMATLQADFVGPMRAQGVLPPDVQVRVAGSAEKLVSLKRSFLGEWTGWNLSSLAALVTSLLFLSLVVTYLLMASLFENWTYPLVIMFSVPIAWVGGFLGLGLVHHFYPEQQLDVLAGLGFIILTGVVVNNAILIVHQTLNFMHGKAESGLQADGQPVRMHPRDAIAESVRTRVRPIFMTTATSVFGMLPLVVQPALIVNGVAGMFGFAPPMELVTAGTELYRGLGSVVLGGLVLASVVTLVLVPLLLSVVFDIRHAVLRVLRLDRHDDSTDPGMAGRPVVAGPSGGA